jgi:hypothetical protein
VGVQRIDVDTAESTAGLGLLLRGAAEVASARSEAEGPGSSRRLLALGFDLAADEARSLLSDAINVDGLVPVGADPVVLLRSAEQLLGRVYRAAASAPIAQRVGTVCRAGMGGARRCLHVTAHARRSCWPQRRVGSREATWHVG